MRERAAGAALDGPAGSVRVPSRRRIVTTATVAIVVVAGVTAALVARSSDAGSTTDGSGAAPSTTARVERRDLVEEESFSGTLGHARAVTVSAGLSGTVTSLRREGAVVGRGESLYQLDEEPVSLLYGSTPAYRTLRSGVEDGRDVEQLERNLVALGYDPNGYIEVDQEFDWATEAAIEAWQEDLGVAEDGVVELGEVVFFPGKIRIGSHHTSIGSTVAPGTSVVDVSSNRPVVTAKVAVDQRGLLREGMKVDVDLPNGKTVVGRVRSIGRVAERGSDDDGDATVDVTVELSSNKELGGLDRAPVTINVAADVKRDTLAVPVAALLALAEGGYALEVVDDGGRRLVAVTTGKYANGYVEVHGRGIVEGTKVVVPG